MTSRASILVWGVVDPADRIAECNDGNNADVAGQKLICQSVQ